MSKREGMNSRQIAEHAGKPHDVVLADIEKMLIELSLNPSDYLEDCKDATGLSLKQYALDIDLTMTLLTGYDPMMLFAIIKRIDELS